MNEYSYEIAIIILVSWNIFIDVIMGNFPCEKFTVKRGISEYIKIMKDIFHVT